VKVDQVIQLRTNLDELVSKNVDLLGGEHDSLTRKHGVDRTSDLAHAFTKIDDEERLLQIGVVGRVKAGKSSLLNALVFGGDTVLPKAATPMTAALTRLSWGESLSAEVEFFLPTDIDNIRANAEQYAQLHDVAVREQFAVLQKRRAADYASVETDEDLLRKARGYADRKLQDRPALSAAYDQMARMRRAGVSERELGAAQTIEATDLAHLRTQLEAYVAADGRFMPFTKSVHIRLPLDGLRDITIVDTPGLNDPVASREERTCELLKFCDVIFIVSPSGQFLSADDLDLMGRVTHKEGVRELYVLASQVDTQLFGSNHEGGRLNDALKLITRELGEHMVETMTAFKEAHPEIGSTFDKLIAGGPAKLLHSSGVSHGLSARFDKRGSWDEGAAKVWENLSTHFPDYFPADNAQVATANLDRLANVGALHGVIDGVRGQKEAIKSGRREALAQTKGAALVAYRDDLVSYVRQRHAKIGASDIATLSEQRARLEKQSAKLTEVLQDLFRDKVHEFSTQLEESLTKAMNAEFDALEHALEGSKKTTIETYQSEDSGKLSAAARWLGIGGYTTQSYREATVVTAPVRNAIISISDKIQRAVDKCAKAAIREWEKSLRGDLFSVLRAGISDNDLDGDLARRTIRDLIDNLKRPALVSDLALPGSLGERGTLKGTVADDYIEAAIDHAGSLRRRFESGIDHYVKDMEKLKDTKVAALFLAGYGKQVETLENEIRNKTLVTERLAQLVADLNAVTQ
jgi:iron-sulfur cluster repair protein YtfE (RIC family)